MASLQMSRSALFPFFDFGSDFNRKSSFLCAEFDLAKLQKRRRFRFSVARRFKVQARPQEKENESNGEEPPESLFMKELKRRGMTPTSLLEDTNKSSFGLSETERNLTEDGIGGPSKRNGVISADYEKSLSNQRERSVALNSEGLEGLIPRAKLLLTLGGTFFVGFWPLILITIGIFSATYFFLGPSFVHDGNDSPVSPPPYIDPYMLLEDEVLSQSAPKVK